ncbi:MAG: sugar phosphate isomerase/epimerase family protein [Pseudomonadota bacterium]
MNRAISNIAWSPNEALEAYRILQRHGVKGLEFAPGLLFPDTDNPLRPTKTALADARVTLSDFGLQPVSMQSLHFATPGAALFGDTREKTLFIDAIEQATDLAAALSVGNIVIGSPKNRVIPDALPLERAIESAVTVFRSLGDKAAKVGVTLAIEANPTAYGTNFLTSSESVIDFCETCAHPAVRMNLDLGTVVMNDRSDALNTLVQASASIINHVHISARQLGPITQNSPSVVALANAVKAIDFQGWTSVEMRRVGGAPLNAIETACRTLRAHY